MKVTITFIRKHRQGEDTTINIVGDVDITTTHLDKIRAIAGTLFEVEYAINEHLPHIRCHISTGE